MEWREQEKQSRSPVTISEEDDKEEYLNSTQNLLRLQTIKAIIDSRSLKKDQRFEWTDDCQKAFDEVKKQFMEELVLMMPDHTRPFPD